MQSPWSGYPGYTSVQVQDFNRAGEEAFMIKGSYDFSRLGLEGVTAYALLVHGWGASILPPIRPCSTRTNTISICSGAPRLTSLRGFGSAADMPAWTNMGATNRPSMTFVSS